MSVTEIPDLDAVLGTLLNELDTAIKSGKYGIMFTCGLRYAVSLIRARKGKQ